MKRWSTIGSMPLTAILLLTAGCVPVVERTTTPVLEAENVKIHVGPEEPAGEKKSEDAE